MLPPSSFLADICLQRCRFKMISPSGYYIITFFCRGEIIDLLHALGGRSSVFFSFAFAASGAFILTSSLRSPRTRYSCGFFCCFGDLRLQSAHARFARRCFYAACLATRAIFPLAFTTWRGYFPHIPLQAASILPHLFHESVSLRLQISRQRVIRYDMFDLI